MSAPHADRLDAMVDAARASAAQITHPWDEQAIDWPDLTSESVVIEVGGYVGRWALQMADRYAPQLYVFEPQPWAAAVCRQLLGERATVITAALGVVDGTFPMGDWETDGCSFVKAGSGSGRMVEAGAALRDLGITTIDLLLMNIEGYEYTLLPYLLDQGIRPRRLMVQFHLLDGDAAPMARLFAQLTDAGYRMRWTYGVVLTAWERE